MLKQPQSILLRDEQARGAADTYNPERLAIWLPVKLQAETSMVPAHGHPSVAVARNTEHVVDDRTTVVCPYLPGRRVFVKETFAVVEQTDGAWIGEETRWRAEDWYVNQKWSSAAMLTADRARTWLRIAEVRAVQLHELLAGDGCQMMGGNEINAWQIAKRSREKKVVNWRIWEARRTAINPNDSALCRRMERGVWWDDHYQNTPYAYDRNPWCWEVVCDVERKGRVEVLRPAVDYASLLQLPEESA